MGASDGSRILSDATGRRRKIAATRWQELGDDVISIARISEALAVASGGHLGRCDFQLLNATQGYSALCVGGQCDCIGESGPRAQLPVVEHAMRTSPSGGTPLTEAIERVIAQIVPAAATLKANGQQVAVVIATDGLPNHPPSFLHAVQTLQTLPVWLVVRLCTDDESVVNYWNDLDKQLEMPLEVLDDVCGEAEEVHGCNSWLTYGPPLHLARMFGLPEKLFDALDEETLLPSQCKLLIERLLGCAPLPEPQLDRAAFIAQVRRVAREAPTVYDPRTGRMRPWVDAGALDKHARDALGEGCLVM